MTDITERLRATIPMVNDPVSLKPKLVNPDGPAAADEIERLRAALAFYADKTNWCDHACAMAWTGCEEALQDQGERARTALRGQG